MMILSVSSGPGAQAAGVCLVQGRLGVHHVQRSCNGSNAEIASPLSSVLQELVLSGYKVKHVAKLEGDTLLFTLVQ